MKVTTASALMIVLFGLNCFCMFNNGGNNNFATKQQQQIEETKRLLKVQYITTQAAYAEQSRLNQKKIQELEQKNVDNLERALLNNKK
ncbi:MAG TPA: hypothetical protein VLB80_03645 [Candidatus Babeliales bacterium]|nr:hypothetical protein [Candidatus Babeliales bacterium]